MLSTRLTMKAMPAGGLDVPLSAPNWIDSQPAGSVTVSDSGELDTSVPATVRVAMCWPELGPGDDVSAADGGAVAAGLQAAPHTTIAVALTTSFRVLFTD